MNCLESMNLLQCRLDGEPTGDATALDEHLAQCPSCRAHFAAAQRMVRGLKSAAWPTPPALLSERIVSEVLEDRRLRRARLKRRLWVTVALAASILLFAAGGYLWVPGAKKKTQQPEVADVKQPNVRDALGSLADDLAGKTRQNAEKLWKLVPPPEIGSLSLPSMAKIEDSLEPAKEELRRTGRELTQSLQIVTQTTFQAFDFFARELPATRVTN